MIRNSSNTRCGIVSVLRVCVTASLLFIGASRAADQPPVGAPQMFRQYCFQCHGNAVATAGVSLEKLTAVDSVADTYRIWERVVDALRTNHMPPAGMPQPTGEQRQQSIAWVRARLDGYIKAHAGDPGHVTVRRLTSGEYAYTIHDLTGLDLDLGIDASTDSVGGEGFSNFGDVQFLQDANLERYLEAAKIVADHAVVGAGPLQFYSDPGKTGFEMSGINRIKDIYRKFGFRTVSGEGGFSYGLEKYAQVLFAAWEYRHRAQLGEPNATLATLAQRAGVTPRFARHVWGVMNRPDLAYPSSEMAARFHKLPAPTADVKASIAAAHAACEELQKFITNWPGWLFARGDAAYGGAGDESPLIISEKSLQVEGTHHFVFNRGGRAGAGARGAPAGPGKLYLNVAAVNPAAKGKPVVIWRNPTVAFRQGGGRGPATQTVSADGAGNPNATPNPTAKPPVAVQPASIAGGATAGRGRGAGVPRIPLRKAVSEETAGKLNFGRSPDGADIGPDDFASELSTSFEVMLPAGAAGFDFQVDAAVGADRNQVFRIVITDRDDGTSRGIPIRAILGDPKSSGYQTFKAGVLQLAELLPPNANGEPTPADKDPIPEPFDSTPNVPEHDAFDNEIKYVRDDKFIYRNILDDATRAKVDAAWNDVYASFAYQDNYLKLIAEHYGVDLKGKHIGELTRADYDAMPAEPRGYALGLRAAYDSMLAAQGNARARHVEDCLRFASRAWRRPLTDKEKVSLRGFYEKALAEDPDHTRAIKTLLARILVAPGFLYRLEQAPSNVSLVQPAKPVLPAAGVGAPVKTLSNWELASRLSYFLWSSIPDDELRRAASAGELTDPRQLRKQAGRMLADPKARRLGAEFFGQWLGFYQFDQFKGVDTTRFPEFTNEVKASMYDEAVSFFEYIIRNDRPVKELLTADYTFLNQVLAKYYGISKDIKAKDQLERVEAAGAFHRGGLLRLGAILTATSAPLRTSPVRRGDWVLRRILGTAVPPPPPDAGSIPADDKLFGGLSVRERLQVHKRNATCATCHSRIDPLGFPLEHYDSTGRWREKYSDGKPIDDFGTFSDQTEVTGIDGLLAYLDKQGSQVRRTLAHKLIGYALGRTLQLSDEPLVDNLVAAGGEAGFSRLVGDIVVSKQFRNRVTEENDAASAATRRADAQVPKDSSMKNSAIDKAGGR